MIVLLFDGYVFLMKLFTKKFLSRYPETGCSSFFLPAFSQKAVTHPLSVLGDYGGIKKEHRTPVVPGACVIMHHVPASVMISPWLLIPMYILANSGMCSRVAIARPMNIFILSRMAGLSSAIVVTSSLLMAICSLF